jgi:hypothetical protein
MITSTPQRPEIRWRQHHQYLQSSHKNCVLLCFVFIEKAKQRDMKRAPTSLKARAHGIIQGNKCLFHLDNREIKAQCIGNNFLSTGAGISSPINCLIASKISSLLKFYQKNQKQRGYSFWKIQSFIRC